MATYQEISPDEANRRLDEFHAVDVRADHEFRGPLGHVRDSVLIPMPELEERIAELPEDRPLLLVCRSGKRSGVACERLRKLGIGPVANLTGGMIAWNHAQLPLERPDPESLADLLGLITAWLAQVGPLTPRGARDLVMRRLECFGVAFEQPTHAAVESTLDFVEDALSPIAPADLDLSLASFRRSLAIL